MDCVCWQREERLLHIFTWSCLYGSRGFHIISKENTKVTLPHYLNTSPSGLARVFRWSPAINGSSSSTRSAPPPLPVHWLSPMVRICEIAGSILYGETRCSVQAYASIEPQGSSIAVLATASPFIIISNSALNSFCSWIGVVKKVGNCVTPWPEIRGSCGTCTRYVCVRCG
jgi:hypothetical protein